MQHQQLIGAGAPDADKHRPPADRGLRPGSYLRGIGGWQVADPRDHVSSQQPGAGRDRSRFDPDDVRAHAWTRAQAESEGGLRRRNGPFGGSRPRHQADTTDVAAAPHAERRGNAGIRL